jgi:hypothetical protein
LPADVSDDLLSVLTTFRGPLQFASPSGRRAAAVCDNDVKSPVGVDCGLNGAFDVGALPHVPADGRPANSLGFVLQIVGVAGEDDDVRLFLGERLRGRQPEPG